MLTIDRLLAPEQLYFDSAPVAHIVAWEEHQRSRRLEQRCFRLHRIPLRGFSRFP